MKKILFILFIVSIILISGCKQQNIDPKYDCSKKSDCYGSTDTCECVTIDFYKHIENNSCENFGCDCINNFCTKTAPIGK